MRGRKKESYLQQGSGSGAAQKSPQCEASGKLELSGVDDADQ
jgi:hypothetical protein